MEQVQSGSQEPRTSEEPEARTVACALPEAAFVRRADQVIADLSHGVDQVVELADGYALRFPGTEGWIAKLVDFVVTERDCCPFFAFEMAFEPEGGPVWLKLRGDGVKEFLELVHPLASG